MSARAVLRAALGALLPLLAACAASAKLTTPLQGPPPATIAVLPLEGGDLPPRARVILRRAIGSFLEDRRYAQLDDGFVDQQLALAGLMPWKPAWAPGDARLAEIGRTMAADALVVAEGFEDSRFSAGVFFRRGLGGRVRMIDARSGATVWSVDAASSDSGGLLTGSGQAIKALSATFNAGSDAAFARLAIALAIDVAEKLPENPNPMEVRPRPAVDAVAVRSAAGEALTAGDVVEIEARGTPRSRAAATIAGRVRDYPLVEVAPGVYQARVRLEPGAGEGEGPATVALRDSYGSTSSPRRSETSVAIFAPRLEVPGGLAAEIVDREARRVRLRWSPAPGASGYAVVRNTGGMPVTTKVDGRIEFQDQVPSTRGSVTYFVSAISPSGAMSAPSSPLVVPF